MADPEPKTVAMEGPKGRLSGGKPQGRLGASFAERRATSARLKVENQTPEDRIAGSDKPIPLIPVDPIANDKVLAGAEVDVGNELDADTNRPMTIGRDPGSPVLPAELRADGGGGSGPVQTGQTTVTKVGPNIDRAAAGQRTTGAIDYLARAKSAQLDAEAAGLGIRSNIYQDYNLQQQEDVFPLLQAAEQIFDEAKTQMVGIQEMADDVRANRINPGQFFANVGDAGTFAASMAVAAGHLASAMGGGPNTALNVIKGAIDRNMRSQALNQAHDRAALNAQIQIFDRMRSMGVDRLNQANVYNSLLTSMAQSRLEAAAAATASVTARAQIGVVQAELALKNEELQMKIAGTIQSVATMKHFALADSAQRGAKVDPIEVFKGAYDRSFGNAEQLVQGEKELPEDFAERASQNDAQLQKTFLNNLAQDFQQKTGGPIDPRLFAQLQQAVPELRGASYAEARLPYSDEVITAGGRQFQITDQFKNFTTKEDQAALPKQLNRNIALIQKWSRLHQLAGKVVAASGTGGTLSKLFAYNKKTGDFSIVGGTGGGKEFQQNAVEFRNLMNAILVDTKRTQSKDNMEAVHGPGEFAIFKLQALIPTDESLFASALLDGDTQNLIAPAFRGAKQDLRNSYAPWFHDIDFDL